MRRAPKAAFLLTPKERKTHQSDMDEKIPIELARLADQPRVLVRRSGPPREGARSIVYWMQRSMRIVDNPALDVAIEAGNLLGLPVVVFFSVIPNYPNANLRHYHFLQQGLRDVAEDAAERGVGFVVRRHPDNSLEAFLEEVRASLLIGDENPCREPERWRTVLARRLRLPYWTVDADVVVPSRVFGRTYFLLHHFRPHLQRELPKFLVENSKVQSAARVEGAQSPGELLSFAATSPPVSRNSIAPSRRSTPLRAVHMPR